MKQIYTRAKSHDGVPCPVCNHPVAIINNESKCKHCGAETDWEEKKNKPMKIGTE